MKDLPQPPITSWAYAKQRITSEKITKWRKQILTEKSYRSSGLLGGTDPKMIKQIKHTSDSWFLKRSGGKSRENARLTRMISGHAPIGAFRERFNLESPQEC